MEPSFNFPATPGMPLFQLSPGRVNTLSHSPSASDLRGSPIGTPSKLFGHPEFGVPGNFGSNSFVLAEDLNAPLESPFALSLDSGLKPPSLPGSPTKHARTSSDVQAMVSRFNSLDIKDHAELRRRDAAALKRAQMGREEAEAEGRRFKSELATMKERLEEGKERERKMAKRLDITMDDLHRSKETQAQTQSLYEKEIRKARKEAFKSSSTLVKLQEELKSARNVLRSVQSDLDLERIKVQRREQDTFTAQYELVGVQEEMARSLTRIRVLEEEREALKTSLKEEEMARVAAERSHAQSAPTQDDALALPRQERPDTPSVSPRKEDIPGLEEIEQLREELDAQRRALIVAEDQIDFMKMECQLGCCSCRLAENQHQQFVHNGTFDSEVQQIKSAVAGMLTPPASVRSQTLPLDLEEKSPATLDDVAPTSGSSHDSIPASRHSTNPTMETHQITVGHAALPVMQQSEVLPNEGTAHETFLPHEKYDVENAVSSSSIQIATAMLPATPQNQGRRTLTTTVTVPLVDHSNTDYSAFATPTGLTREQAIEQLRQRRGRARSVVGTQRKALEDRVTPRRDISAPQMTAEATPASSVRGRGR